MASSFMQSLPAAAVEAMTPLQRGFITSIRLLEADASMVGNTILRAVADMFPPARLFGDDLRAVPAVYTELRNFLDSRVANMQQHPSRRIMLTLATNLYDDPDDQAAAVEIVKGIIPAGRRTVVPDPTPSSPAAQPSAAGTHSTAVASSDKLAHNVAMRLKDRDKKFSGDIGECWQEFVDEYRQIARDYGLTASQKLQYLHNLLRGDAKRYYLDTIEGYATTFQQSVDMVEKEYNSQVRQNKVKNYLKTLRMSNFVAEGADMASALEKVYKVILKLSRQVPATHRGDVHKVEFLSSAVAGYEWATEPLGRMAIYGLNFQQLYGELESQLQLSKEAEVARLQDQIFARSSGRSDNHDSKVPGILYQGQARYGRRPSSLRSDGRKRVSFGTSPTVKKFDPLSVSGCFNCDSPDHMLKDCRLPLNVARSASKKLEYYAKKKSNPDLRIHLVLAELCYQLDVSAPEAEEGFSDEVVKLYNKAVRTLKETRGLALRYLPLNEEQMHLRVYTDASFATNDDMTSQLGYIILLCDEDGIAHVPDYGSRKCRRVVRSKMGGELYAFSHGFDSAFILKNDLERAYGRPIAIKMFTHSKQLFDFVTKGSSSTERRLMIDIAAVRESYKNQGISDVASLQVRGISRTDSPSLSLGKRWTTSYTPVWTTIRLSNGLSGIPSFRAETSLVIYSWAECEYTEYSRQLSLSFSGIAIGSCELLAIISRGYL